MFAEYDCFRLRRPFANESIQVGTIGGVLIILSYVPPAYEVEFPDGGGGNLGSKITFTIDESYMEPM